MAEKLIIKNFAGIKELEIEVKRINILIGPQASGKSVCAKLLYYFKNFIWEILESIENRESNRDLDTKCIRDFKDFFPIGSWGNHDFSLKYEISNDFIEINRKYIDGNEINFKYSDFFKDEIKRLSLYQKQIIMGNSNDRESDIFEVSIIQKKMLDSLKNRISIFLPQEASFRQIFIPAGRSFFAIIKSNVYSFLSSDNTLDPFMKGFGMTYESIKYQGVSFVNRENVDKDIKDLQEEVSHLIKKSLCGDHFRDQGEDFLRMEDGRQVSAANASSGQQEALPLTITLDALPVLNRSGMAVYIEELEAHLFPNAQRSIVELIATVFNYPKQKLQFFLTTHSPYVLTSINNLLQAGILYQDPTPETLSKLKKIIPQYKSLNTSDLSAYMLENGECYSIISNETGLIDARIIDSVSTDLAIEFDQLLDLA
jgi:AAA ATPase domain